MATTATEAVATGAAHAEKTGLPQLNFATFPNQIFWLAVTLAIIYLVLTRVALPRIGVVLAERSGTITNDLAAAEEFKQKAVQAEKAYNDALATARGEAAKIVAAAKADIQIDLDKATAKADADIAVKAVESEAKINEIKAGAIDAITQVSKDTAHELVAALGGKADAKSITAAVAARLKG